MEVTNIRRRHKRRRRRRRRWKTRSRRARRSRRFRERDVWIVVINADNAQVSLGEEDVVGEDVAEEDVEKNRNKDRS